MWDNARSTGSSEANHFYRLRIETLAEIGFCEQKTIVPVIPHAAPLMFEKNSKQEPHEAFWSRCPMNLVGWLQSRSLLMGVFKRPNNELMSSPIFALGGVKLHKLHLQHPQSATKSHVCF